MKDLLTVSQSTKILGIITTTIRKLENSGYILFIRTKGNHRRYKNEDLQNLVGKKTTDNIESVDIYYWVSSHEQKQKGDLERQKNRLIECCARNGYKLEYIFEDVASGVSNNRPKLKHLFKLVKEQKK